VSQPKSSPKENQRKPLARPAPGIPIIDVQVYEGERVESAQATRGLNWVADNAQKHNIKVVNVSLSLPSDDPALRAAVRQLVRADIVVVAASGDRAPGDEPAPNEDFGDSVFPAGYAKVVTVGATTTGSPEENNSEFGLPSSRIDVVAPTYGAISLSSEGRICVVDQVATSWAAAEVSGLVALMRIQFPQDNAAQIIARMKRTATGSDNGNTPFIGAGEIRPVAALTAPLSPNRSGRFPGREAIEAGGGFTAPAAPTDRVGRLRFTALWWGLLGSGALVLGLLVRPLVRRRS
jgi:membrane-anchored mycosin MYCP